MDVQPRSCADPGTHTPAERGRRGQPRLLEAEPGGVAFDPGAVVGPETDRDMLDDGEPLGG